MVSAIRPESARIKYPNRLVDWERAVTSRDSRSCDPVAPSRGLVARAKNARPRPVFISRVLSLVTRLHHISRVLSMVTRLTKDCRELRSTSTGWYHLPLQSSSNGNSLAGTPQGRPVFSKVQC